MTDQITRYLPPGIDGDNDDGDRNCRKCDGYGIVSWVRRGGIVTEPCLCPAGGQYRKAHVDQTETP